MTTLATLRRDVRGVAFIEFALALPLLLILMTGGIELGNSLMVKIRTEKLARTISDMIARQSGSLDGMSERQFNEIMFATMRQNAGMNMQDNGRVVVTAVLGLDSNNDGIPERNAIQWQRFAGNYLDAPIMVGCWKTTTDVVLPRGRKLVANEPMYHVQVTQKYSPLMVVLFNAMSIPTEVTDTAMFRGRGATFRPMLTSINEKVHDNCTSPDGV